MNNEKDKKLYCIICDKYRKFEKPKILYLLEKTLFHSIICGKCKNENEKIFKEEYSIETLKLLNLTENIWLLSKYGRKTQVKNLD